MKISEISLELQEIAAIYSLKLQYIDDFKLALKILKTQKSTPSVPPAA